MSRRTPLGREELRAWLTRAGEQSVSDSELLHLLNAHADAIPSASRNAMAFAVAMLRDVYANDADARYWLSRYRREFGGLTAADLLRCGRAQEVESLLVRLWNHRTPVQPKLWTFQAGGAGGTRTVREHSGNGRRA